MVEADITVDTSELVYEKLGYETFNLSLKILCNALLSSTTVASLFIIKRFSVIKEL